MNTKSEEIPASNPNPDATVQGYIDEMPVWKDGTTTGVTPLTRMQWRIWFLATAGKFFEGLVVFMTGVALPLIAREFDLGTTGKGIVAAAPLFGILIGATALGRLADIFGRKAMFIFEIALFILFLILLTFSGGVFWVAIFLFGIGLALGCDYPTAHLIISESVPSKSRGRLVLGAFAFQAVGALVGTAIGFAILYEVQDLAAWRWMYATAIIPAVLVLVGRFFIPDSSPWLIARGRTRQAEHELQRLLQREPPYPKSIRLATSDTRNETSKASAGWKEIRLLFSRKHRKATILASVPWFLQDLSTYGIGIFTPTILATVIGQKSTHIASVADVIHNDILAAKGAAFLDLLLIAGIAVAILLADRVGRIRMQTLGFVGCAAGLLLAALSTATSGHFELLLVFAGFMLFNFMTNMGPNAMTYLIAGEVFPTKIRGLGAGFAASVGKVGAVTTALFFPFLLHTLGTAVLLSILIVLSLLGAWVTRHFAIETAGVNLETLDQDPSEPEDFAQTSNPQPKA